MVRRLRVVMISLGLLTIAGPALPKATGTAEARTKHVSVLSVKGAGYKRVRRWMESQIRGRWKLVAREALVDAARELGINRRRWTRKANLRRIARKARVDAVITSYVYRRRRRWWLAVRVHDGATGRITKGGVVRYRYFRLNRWSKRALLKVIKAGVARVEGVPHPRPRPLRPPPPRPDVPDKPDEPDDPTGDRPAWLTAVHGGVGLSVWARQLSFTNLEGEPGRTQRYQTDTPVAPLGFYVEIFPGAFVSRHRALANVGLGFSFQRAVGVVSYREDDNQMIDTTVQRINGYLVYRLNINRSATSPKLRFALGVDALQFTFADDLEQTAGVQYLSIKPEIEARFPLGTDRVSLAVRFAALGTLSFGQLANAYHYGVAKGGGVQADLEVDVRVYWRLHLRAGFTTTWLFISFSQLGDEGTDYMYVADSARDGYYGGYLLAAIHY
jgi:hypothetical protein